MFIHTTKTRRAVAALMLAMAAFSAPVAGESVSDCYERVMAMCNDAMEDANIFQRVSIGLFCTGMLAGCGFEAL